MAAFLLLAAVAESSSELPVGFPPPERSVTNLNNARRGPASFADRTSPSGRLNADPSGVEPRFGISLILPQVSGAFGDMGHVSLRDSPLAGCRSSERSAGDNVSPF